MSHTDQPTYTAKLFLSADPEPGVESTKRAVVDRVHDLVQHGVLERYEVHAWGKSFRPDGPLAGTRYQQWIADHLDSFEAWASEHDASLGPAFEEHHVDCSLSEECYDVVSLPRVCLALYRDGDLVTLAPSRIDGTLVSPLDALDRFPLERSPSATNPA